jgi:hypothetical protein
MGMEYRMKELIFLLSVLFCTRPVGGSLLETKAMRRIMLGSEAERNRTTIPILVSTLRIFRLQTCKLIPHEQLVCSGCFLFTGFCRLD